MLEAVQVLANTSKYSRDQLENIANEFGNHWLMNCEISVGVLVRACREYENLKNPQDAVTSCARVVTLAEQLVDYTGLQEDSCFQGFILALKREIDNLRNYNRVAARKAGQNPG